MAYANQSQEATSYFNLHTVGTDNPTDSRIEPESPTTPRTARRVATRAVQSV